MRAPLLPFAAVAIAVSISISMAADAWSLRTTTAEQLSYALILGVIVLALLAGKNSGRRSPHLGLAVGAWGVLLTIELLQAPFSHSSTAIQVLTDYGTTVMPVALALAVGMWVTTRQQLTVLLTVVSFAAVFAAILAFVLRDGTARFEAPSIIAIVGAWTIAAVPDRHSPFGSRQHAWLRVAAFTAAMFLFPVIMASRSRTALAVWVFSGIIVLIVRGLQHFPLRKASGLVAAFTMLMLVYSGGTSAWSDEIAVWTGQARLDSLANPRADQSTQSRINEVSDALDTLQRDGDVLDALLGLGHGASYLPNRSYIANNVDTTTGLVHSIHVTPIMVLFRYGVIGLCALALLMLGTCRSALSNAWRDRELSPVLLALASVAYIADSGARNVFADPCFGLVIAAVAVFPYLKAQAVVS